MIFFTYHCIVQFTVHHIRFKRKKSPTAYLCTRIEQHLSVNSLLFVTVHNAVDNILSILNNNDNIYQIEIRKFSFVTKVVITICFTNKNITCNYPIAEIFRCTCTPKLTYIPEKHVMERLYVFITTYIHYW